LCFNTVLYPLAALLCISCSCKASRRLFKSAILHEHSFLFFKFTFEEKTEAFEIPDLLLFV
jgi:hypothetical protein